ncbi:MAG: pyridoxamine 5'-phosphate oxidase family protein, partial [Solirubrobacteraceae bacterium]
MAEDAVQDAFEAAVTAWRRDGVPANPGAWITTAARRRAIGRLRRDRSVIGRAERLAELIRLDAQHEETSMDDESTIVDDRLRLISTCCHPALEMPARVALTLRALGGLTTGEIARAFLVAEPTMGKRIVRAKSKITEARIPYRVPADEELPDRLRGVLRVVYPIFNEGYAATEGDRLVRGELCDEAIRLGELLVRLMPDEADVWGLSALMLLHDARSVARVDPSGRFAALEDQDRSLWDRARIDEGLARLERAVRLRRPGEYQLQAAITVLEMQAPDAETTDWAQIADLHGALARLTPSPVVDLNRAVAVAHAEGPAAGLELLEPLFGDPALQRYQPLHAAHAELLRRAGDAGAAARAALSDFPRAVQIALPAATSCRGRLFGRRNSTRRLPLMTTATPQLRVRRAPKRARYDLASIHRVLDRGHVAHVAFVENCFPYCIPTLYARVGDRLVIHGSSASRMVRALAAGAPACVTVTILDEFVLARSAFKHSANYDSAVLVCTLEQVADEEKLAALEAFVEGVLPGRWDEVRHPSRKELKATAVLAMPIANAAVKTRTGPPDDDSSPDAELDVWAGVV